MLRRTASQADLLEDLRGVIRCDDLSGSVLGVTRLADDSV